MASDKPAIALFQPDIAGNTGTLIRLAACTATELHIVEPAGFRTDDKALRRAGMDYAEMASLNRHTNWTGFRNWADAHGKRIVLLTTKAQTSYLEFVFHADDVLLLGRESAGVPDEVHADCDHRLKIPMATNTRSLNVALSGAMVLGEALRQTGGLRAN
jgi:tRNA (cytidine/uridine-2'-O-)-methyltransferase